MVTKKPVAQEDIKIKEWSSGSEIDMALSKLRRRVVEAEALDARDAVVNNTGADDVVVSNVRTSILEVFGENSPEYEEYRHVRMWAGPMYMGMQRHEIAEATEGGRLRLLAILNNLIVRLQEKREEIAERSQPSAKEMTRAINLHPRIADVAANLFEDGYHWEAVFAASKALVNFVKDRSGNHDLDGTGLMRTVFSRNNPILAFNELKDQTDSDEQEGMMHLFEGVILGIRNPGGHSFPEGPMQRAAEYLSLLSLLAYRTQETRRKNQP